MIKEIRCLKMTWNAFQRVGQEVRGNEWREIWKVKLGRIRAKGRERGVLKAEGWMAWFEDCILHLSRDISHYAPSDTSLLI